MTLDVGLAQLLALTAATLCCATIHLSLKLSKLLLDLVGLSERVHEMHGVNESHAI